MSILASIPASVNGSLGIETDLRVFCRECGVEFDCEGFRVPSRDKTFPLYDLCHQHRGIVVDEPTMRTGPSKQELADKWKRVCPESYRNIEPGSLPEALRFAIRWYKYSPKGMFISGGSGTHKSRASHRLMENLFMQGKTVKLFHPSEFFEQCMDSFDKSNHSLWVSNIVNADCVLFDDLGQEKYTERTSAAFFSICDRRLASSKPTFYNTNFASEALLDRLPAENGLQLLRRIVDGCTFFKTGASPVFQALPF